MYHVRLIALIFVSFLAVGATQAGVPSDTSRVANRLSPLRDLSPYDVDEVVWLARCMLSESDRLDEQRLVAWAVRNRVETSYRGDTYREVVLEAQQFSAFNTPSARRESILKLDQHSAQASWRRTLEIAAEVYLADPSERPFPITTRHFYSPISMVNHATPEWAKGREAVDLSAYGVDPFRFKFYSDVDSAAAGIRVGPSTVAGTGAHRPTTDDVAASGGTRLVGRRLKLSGKVARPQRPTVARPARIAR